MKNDITTVTVSKAVYEIIQDQAKLDERSVRIWLQRFIVSSFPQLKENEDDGLFNGLEPEPELKPVAKTWHQIYMGQTGRKKMSMYETFMEYGQDSRTNQ